MLLHSKIYGDKGIPMLIFHGLLGMGDNWASMARKWESDYQVHLIDLRNHGKSPKSDQMDYEIIFDDILSYLKHFKLENPVALGHSLGGKILMHFSLSYPSAFQKIIIGDIAPRPYPLQYQKVFDALKKVDLDTIATRKQLDECLSELIKEADIRALILKNTYVKEQGGLDFLFNWRAIEKNYKRLIQGPMKELSYTRDSLFLRAQHSDYILEEDIVHIYKYFPKAKIVEIKNARHWFQLDNPNDVYKEVSAFLKE